MDLVFHLHRVPRYVRTALRPKRFLILEFSLDILHIIANFLPPANILCLALACKALLFASYCGNTAASGSSRIFPMHLNEAAMVLFAAKGLRSCFFSAETHHLRGCIAQIASSSIHVGRFETSKSIPSAPNPTIPKVYLSCIPSTSNRSAFCRTHAWIIRRCNGGTAKDVYEPVSDNK